MEISEDCLACRNAGTMALASINIENLAEVRATKFFTSVP